LVEYSHQDFFFNTNPNRFIDNTYGLGILSNSQNPQMEMPIGYYMGLLFSFNNGTIDYEIPLDGINTLENKGRTLKVIFGKDTALLPSISLDLNLEFGYKWGYVYAENYYETPPSILFPRDNYISNNVRFKEDILDSTTGPNTSYRYARFLVMPRVKLGFMF